MLRLKLFAFIFVAIAFLFLQNEKVNAECPEGFTQKFVNLTIGDCLYSVEICYKCVGTNIGAIQIFGFGLLDSCEQDPPISANEIYDSICVKVYNANFIVANLCDSIPPCDKPPGGVWYMLSWYLCWQKDTDLSENVWYYPCWTSNAICRELWRFCWDPVLGIYQHIKEGDTDLSGDYNCEEDEEPEDPEPGHTSSCFHFNTPCNPDD